MMNNPKPGHGSLHGVAISYLTPKVFLRAYTALVRPVLEYSIRAWSPTTASDITKIENVQRMATKLVPSLRLLPCGWPS